MRTAWKLFQIIWWSIEKLWNHLSVVLKPSRFFWNHLYHLRIPASSFWRNVPAGKELISQLSVPMSTKWKWKCSWEAEKQVLCQRGSNVKKKKKIRRTFHTKWIKIEDCFGDSKTNLKKNTKDTLVKAAIASLHVLLLPWVVFLHYWGFSKSTRLFLCNIINDQLLCKMFNACIRTHRLLAFELKWRRRSHISLVPLYSSPWLARNGTRPKTNPRFIHCTLHN